MPESNKQAYVIGADLGGTNVRAALIERATGNIIARSQNISSKALEGADVTATQIAVAVDEAITSSSVPREQVAGLGLAVPGHIHPADGMVLFSPNFHNQWRNVSLARMVSEKVNMPVVLGNDANMAAFGEFTYGIGRGTRHLVLFTLGTGIGGGIVIDGNLLTGADGGAAELGHIFIAAGEHARGGNAAFGTLEGLTQRDAITERAARKLSTGRKSILSDGAVYNRADLTPKAIADAAMAGDQVGIETIEETGYYLGLGVASVINIFNPEIVVIGGGIAQAGDLLMAPIIRSAKVNAIPTLFATCRIVTAELGDNAGIVGAAALIAKLGR